MSRAEFTIQEVKSVFTPKAVIEAGYNVKPELEERLEWPAAATLKAEEGFTIIELKAAGARPFSFESSSHLHRCGRTGYSAADAKEAGATGHRCASAYCK